MVMILVLVILLIGVFFKVICPQNDEIIVEDTSPRPAEGYLFHVFLSFSGKDTRKTFTSHLLHDLHTRGISTFIDSENLEKGEEIEGLLGYIEKSKICIPIISKGYAHSKWCLRELAQMVECKKEKEVLPVFFDVDPSDVKKQSGPFASAFKKHESDRKLEEKEVRKWRKALTKVGNISGFSLKETDGDEAKLKLAIIKRVLSEVNKMPMEVATHPVGTETRLADVKKILENGGSYDVHIVGIHGMGGIGKTTIAKTVYNDLTGGFNGASCFISNIRKVSGQPNGLMNLQKQLIGHILKEKDKSISDVAEGVSIIKKRAKSTKVLLILDDVDSVEQLEALAGGRDWFGSGSVIIITTRDEQVLRAHGMKQQEIYKPRELNDAESLELFTHHAFKGEQPQGEFIKLSKQFVAAAGGLPLTLKEVGLDLSREKDPRKWQVTLESLKKTPPKKVQESLKLSYDGLSKLEKEIFLDISCLFIGRDRKYATYMWEGCDWSPDLKIDALEKRSLVKKNESSGVFEMHVQLRDMGRAIVKEEICQDLQKQSRLWNSQDSMGLLQRNDVSGTVNVEAIRFSPCDERLANKCVSSRCFEKMPNLRYFEAARVNFKGTFHHFPGNMRWLDLQFCHFDSLPSDLNLQMIVIMSLFNTNMAQIFINQWSLRRKAFEKLKVLNCRAEIKITPDFTCFPCLVELTLHRCSMLSTIDESIGELKKLVYICIKECEILKKLPDSICGLSSLEVLNIQQCSTISSLPKRLGDLQSLTKFILVGTSIVELPDSIGQLKNLHELRIEGSQNLSRLPDSICQLSSLQKLGVQSCDLSTIPERLGNMASLKELDLINVCIKTIPDSIELLSNLRKLSLKESECLRKLPHSICQLSSLKSLDLRGCSNICSLPERLGEMEKLEELMLDGARIEAIPDSVGQLSNLCELSLRDSKCLQKLPDSICQLSSLKSLDLSWCFNLCSLPKSLGDMEKLEVLVLDGAKIEAIPDSVGQLMNLGLLSLKNCELLKALPDSIRKLSSLQQIKMDGIRLRGFENIPHLASFEVLTISSSELSFLSNQTCRALTHLRLVDASIEELPNCVGGMENLEKLLLECEMLRSLPNWMDRFSQKLIDLQITSKHLNALPDCIGSLELLRWLSLECGKLKALPDSIGRLKNIWSFKIESANLKALPDSIGGLKKLKSFSLSGCENLESLTGFADLSSLQSLQLEDCKSLEYLPQLPSSLRRLDASGCTNLKNMSDVSDLKKLVKLNLNGCRSLKNVPGLENIASNLEELGLPGPWNFRRSCHLSHVFRNKVFKNEEITFGNLKRFEMSGSVVRGSAAGQQQLHFVLPRLPFSWLRKAWLTLRLYKVVSPIHLLFTADDMFRIEKVEVMVGDEVEFNLREVDITMSWEGAEKKRCYEIRVTADGSQLQNFSALLQQKNYSYKE